MAVIIAVIIFIIAVAAAGRNVSKRVELMQTIFE